MNSGPDRLAGEPVAGVALLGTLHVLAPVRTLADSLLEQRLRTSCPSVTVLTVAETAQRFAARGLVPPRELSAEFAREARDALGVDLLLAPMALGLTYDTRTTFAGLMDAIARPTEYAFDDRAGIALEGWDLRSAERTVGLVRTHASEKSWTGNPEHLLRNAIGDAVRRLASRCAPGPSAAARPTGAAPVNDRGR